MKILANFYDFMSSVQDYHLKSMLGSGFGASNIVVYGVYDD